MLLFLTPQLRHETRASFRLALPIVIGQLSAIGMPVVDTLLAGNLGSDALAAVAVGSAIWSLVLVLIIGVNLAVAPSVAQLDGAGKRKQIGPLFRQSLWLAFALGLLLGLAVFQAKYLLVLANIPAAIIIGADDFLRGLAWGAPAMSLYFACRGLSEGLSITRPTMYFGFLGLAILAPLGYAMMFGVWGFPALGVYGLGIATSIAMWLQLLAIGGYLGLRAYYSELDLFEAFEWPNFAAIGELLHIGLPMGVTLFMEASLFIASALLIGSMGETPVAAHQIAMNLASIAFMVPLGLAMAATVRVGNAVGQMDVAKVRLAGAATLMLTLLAQSLSAAIMLIFGAFLISLYSQDAAVMALAGQLLLVAALFQFSDGIQAIFNGALRGLKDTKVPMLITGFSYWGVGMSLGYGLSFIAGWGAIGMWIGLVAGLTTAAILLSLRFHLLTRSQQVLQQTAAQADSL